MISRRALLEYRTLIVAVGSIVVFAASVGLHILCPTRPSSQGFYIGDIGSGGARITNFEEWYIWNKLGTGTVIQDNVLYLDRDAQTTQFVCLNAAGGITWMDAAGVWRDEIYCVDELTRLRKAIRLHRDTRGQYEVVTPRDQKLYDVLPETAKWRPNDPR
jgi:hypothetical protein